MKNDDQIKATIPEELRSYLNKHGDSLFYTVIVTDKDGKVLNRISAPSKSYVQQWNQILNVQASQYTKTIKDTDGVNRSVPSHPDNLWAKATYGITDKGLRIGKGTTAVAITDYALESPLAQGTGVDQFTHYEMGLSLPSVAGSTCSFTISRVFINNSGATITGIREIGCYVEMYNYYGLGFRDVLPSAVYVPHGGSITVTYTIAVTV